MKKLVYLSFLFSFHFAGCQNCEDIIESEYLKGDLYLSTTIRNCSGTPKQYVVKSSNDESVFEMRYDSLGVPEKSVEGDPWIQVIWNKQTYSKGDSLILKFVVPSPPELNHNFRADATNIDVEFYEENEVYFVLSKLTNDSELSVQIDYQYRDSPWLTFSRTYTIDL